jgi:hypothetical protein
MSDSELAREVLAYVVAGGDEGVWLWELERMFAIDRWRLQRLGRALRRARLLAPSRGRRPWRVTELALDSEACRRQCCALRWRRYRKATRKSAVRGPEGPVSVHERPVQAWPADRPLPPLALDRCPWTSETVLLVARWGELVAGDAWREWPETMRQELHGDGPTETVIGDVLALPRRHLHLVLEVLETYGLLKYATGRRWSNRRWSNGRWVLGKPRIPGRKSPSQAEALLRATLEVEARIAALDDYVCPGGALDRALKRGEPDADTDADVDADTDTDDEEEQGWNQRHADPLWRVTRWLFHGTPTRPDWPGGTRALPGEWETCT